MICKSIGNHRRARSPLEAAAQRASKRRNFDAAGRTREFGDRALGAALPRQRRVAHRLSGGHGLALLVGRVVRGLVAPRRVARGGRTRGARARQAPERRRAPAARRRLLSLRQVPFRSRCGANARRAREGDRLPDARPAAFATRGRARRHTVSGPPARRHSAQACRHRAPPCGGH